MSKNEEKNPVGRPPIFTQELADKVLTLIENGHSLHDIDEIEGMPAKRTILRWVRDNEDFRHQYAQAYDIFLKGEEARLIQIADKATTRQNSDAYRLQVDTRKWVLSKRYPKKYGDSKTIQLEGNEEKPLYIKRVPVDGVVVEEDE